MTNKKKINRDNSTYIIAEMTANHLESIEYAKEAGADRSEFFVTPFDKSSMDF